MKMLKDNTLTQNLRDASDEQEEDYEDGDEVPEGELTREDVAEIIIRKKSNRLH